MGAWVRGWACRGAIHRARLRAAMAGRFRMEVLMEREYRAKVFEDEDGQVVCIPDELRFDGDEVWIRRQGTAIILEPVEKRG